MDLTSQISKTTCIASLTSLSCFERESVLSCNTYMNSLAFLDKSYHMEHVVGTKLISLTPDFRGIRCGNRDCLDMKSQRT